MYRKIEREVVEAACIITRVRLTNLVVQVKTAILQSEYPGAVVYMRTVDALRQLYNRYLYFLYSLFTVFLFYLSPLSLFSVSKVQLSINHSCGKNMHRYPGSQILCPEQRYSGSWILDSRSEDSNPHPPDPHVCGAS
jgi:hypothetical protein